VHRCWTSEQLLTLTELKGKVQEAGYRDALKAYLAQDKIPAAALWTILTAAGWSAFWLAFLCVFPRSRRVQAIFFWNPKVRGLFSLGFVPLLLILLPPLRRRLLIPLQRAS
jgi:hypothetical protein